MVYFSGPSINSYCLTEQYWGLLSSGSGASPHHHHYWEGWGVGSVGQGHQAQPSLLTPVFKLHCLSCLSFCFRLVCSGSQRQEGEEDEEPAAAPRVKECRLAGHLQP